MAPQNMSKPGIGERAAASGLRNQYGVGASLVIDALREHDLQWIRVADPEAGRVDDLQIATTGRLDAYQIKWEQYPGTLTLNEFTQGPSPPLVKQLADGWKQLQETHPNRRVVVHLLTNAYASESTGILPDTSKPPSPYHFAAFIEQAWRPAQRDGDLDYAGKWNAVWSALLESSGLEEEVFSQFIQDCKLNLRTPAPPEDEEHREIADLLFRTAAGSERTVEIECDELLDQLGWSQRYEYRNVHEFEVPRFYQPIESTVEDLIDRLEKLPSGYVAVVGSPGSGKSTLLTRTLRSLSVRLVRYYAYVPDAQDPTRGESTSFLHDVTLRLDRAGFGKSGPQSEPSNRKELLKKLHGQLQRLGRNYKESGEPAVILVDGLDHIPREQHPERSLLKDLPHPDQIPEGVFFVLGSQTTNLDNFTPEVRSELDDSDRRVEMDRLSPADVDNIAREAVPELDEEERSKLFDLSAGHPLALIYLVKPLQLADDEEARASILSEAVPYEEDIDEYYWAHWKQVEEDEELVHVLGLLSRVRGAISMEWAAQWIDRPVASKFERLFGRYFDVDSSNRWSFFHNSFRLFLQERTAEPILGGSSEERERSFHAELADFYEGTESPWHWEKIYHLHHAGDHATIVEQATAEWFQEQIQALRPMEAVQADAKLAIRSAGMLEDPLALVRLTLVSATLEQQEHILESYDFADRLLDLGDTAKALDYIRDGQALRVDDPHALRLSSRLAEMGLMREGGRIYQLAEPYDLFTDEPLSEETRRTGNPAERLRAWIGAASHFESPQQVLDTVGQLQIEPEPHSDRSSEEATANFQIWLVIRAVASCAKQGTWSEWREYMTWLEEFDRGELFTAVLRSSKAVLHRDPDRARYLLNQLLERFEPLPHEDWSLRRIRDRLDVAELILRIEQDREAAAEWVGDLLPFPIQESNIPGEDNVSQRDRFRRYRLEYWLGETKSPDRMVDDDMEATNWGKFVKPKKKRGLRRLAFATVTLASLWGKGRRGQQLESPAFMREVAWILDKLSKPYNPPSSLHLELMASRPETVDFLVQTASEHGENVLEALADELEERWQNDKLSNSIFRDAATSLVKVGAGGDAQKFLSQLEGKTGKEGAPADRAEEHWDQAEAWLAAQNAEKARSELQHMTVASRGILYENDHQSEPWVRWMHRANKVDPENAEVRIRTMLRRLVAVSGEASGIREAASALIFAGARWKPTRTVHIMKGLQEKGVLTHKRALSSLLHATLKDTEPPVNAVLHALVNLIIPLASPSTQGLVEELIEATASMYGEREAVSAAQYLVERIRSEALDTDRTAWIERIQEGLQRAGVSPTQAGVAPVEVEDESDEAGSPTGPNTLCLSDGRELTPEEARRAVDSVSDFLKLIDKEDTEHSEFFHWEEVAENAVVCAGTPGEIAKLKEAITARLDGKRSARLLSQLSDKAHGMGETEQAESLAEEALSQSEPEGWDRRWDGGSRLQAIQSIQEVDEEKGRELAIQQYSRDVTDSLLSFKRLLPQLDEVTALLFDEVPDLEIWNLIENYLTNLYEPVDVEPIPEIEQALTDSPVEDSGLAEAATGVSVAVAEYLDHPSYVVGSQAGKASARILLAGTEREEMGRALEEVPSRTEVSKERLLTVLEAVAEEDIDLLSPFEEVLRELAESQNLKIRAGAVKLLSRIEGTPPRVHRVQREVSGVYNLELPDISAHRTEKVAESEEGRTVLNDPARFLRPFDTNARMIAEEAGLDEDVVLYRAAELLKQRLQERRWGIEYADEDQQGLTSFFDDVGLRVAFSKPHIAPAAQAISHVAAELWDDGRLDSGSAQQIEASLFRQDSSLLLREPERRPRWLPTIGGIPEDEQIYTVPEGWLEQTDESLARLYSRTSDGRIILGERSRFVYLGTDPGMEERRMSHIVDASETELWREEVTEGNKPPFFSMYKRPAKWYSQGEVPKGHFVVAHSSFDVQTPASRWIALNPTLGRQLGWRLASDKCFRWIDTDGNVAVESVWWRDGNPDRYDRNKHCAVSEGWLVLASREAYSQIVQKSGHLKRGGLVRRKLGIAGSEGMDSAFENLAIVEV